MGRLTRRGMTATGVALAGCVVLLSAWAGPVSAAGSPGRAGAGTPAAARHCHGTHRHRCAATPITQSVSGTSGGLTVTFSSTQTGSSVTFDIASTETTAYGALGAEVLSFGNGAGQGFATPEYCMANPMAESNDQQVSYTYPQSGTYSASVTVGANCTPDQLTLTLPITVS